MSAIKNRTLPSNSKVSEDMKFEDITEVAPFTSEDNALGKDVPMQSYRKQNISLDGEENNFNGSRGETDDEDDEEEAKVDKFEEAKISSMSLASRSSGREQVDPMVVVPSKALTQCTLIRRRSPANFLHPTYELYLETSPDQDDIKLMVAVKAMSSTATAKYNIYDTTKGSMSSKLTKKGGNYMGKLKSTVDGSRLLLYGRDEGREKLEMGFVEFQTQNVVKAFLNSPTPRKLQIVLPPIKENRPLPNRLPASTSAPDLFTRSDDNDPTLLKLHNKLPELDKGIYRLNFKGRVKMASVKNFQMTSVDDGSEVALQFGKIDKNVFHLDFQSPFTPFQAFAVALSQFDM